MHYLKRLLGSQVRDRSLVAGCCMEYGKKRTKFLAANSRLFRDALETVKSNKIRIPTYLPKMQYLQGRISK